jgi:hypothetical protein
VAVRVQVVTRRGDLPHDRVRGRQAGVLRERSIGTAEYFARLGIIRSDHDHTLQRGAKRQGTVIERVRA